MVVGCWLLICCFLEHFGSSICVCMMSVFLCGCVVFYMGVLVEFVGGDGCMV